MLRLKRMDEDVIAPEAGRAEPLLSRAEIETLLGEAEGETLDHGQPRGPRDAEASAKLIIASRLARFLEADLRALGFPAIEISARATAPGGAAAHLSARRLSVTASFSALDAEDDVTGLLRLDARVVDALLTELFGARVCASGAPYSFVEGAFIRRALDVVLRALSRALEPWPKLDFALDEFEPERQDGEEPPRAVIMRLMARTGSCRGLIELHLPHACFRSE